MSDAEVLQFFFAELVLIILSGIVTIMGLKFRVNESDHLKFLFVYVLIGFIGFSVSSFLSLMRIHNIRFLWGVLIVDTLVLSAYFIKVSPAIARNIRYYGLGLLLVILMTWLHIKLAGYSGVEYYMNYFIAKISFFGLITILVLIHYFDLMLRAGSSRIDQLPEFWGSAGLLIYAAGSFVPEVSNVYGFEFSDKVELQQSRIIRSILSNSVMLVNYLMIMMAFLIFEKNKTRGASL